MEFQASLAGGDLPQKNRTEQKQSSFVTELATWGDDDRGKKEETKKRLRFFFFKTFFVHFENNFFDFSVPG